MGGLESKSVETGSVEIAKLFITSFNFSTLTCYPNTHQLAHGGAGKSERLWLWWRRRWLRRHLRRVPWRRCICGLPRSSSAGLGVRWRRAWGPMRWAFQRTVRRAGRRCHPAAASLREVTSKLLEYFRVSQGSSVYMVHEGTHVYYVYTNAYHVQ